MVFLLLSSVWTLLWHCLISAAIHGALPWQAEHDRRLLLFRYLPGCMQFRPWFAAGDTPSMYEATYPDWLSELTVEQRSVLQAPWRGAHGIVGARPEGNSGQRWTGGRPPAVSFWQDASDRAARVGTPKL